MGLTKRRRARREGGSLDLYERLPHSFVDCCEIEREKSLIGVECDVVVKGTGNSMDGWGVCGMKLFRAFLWVRSGED